MPTGSGDQDLDQIFAHYDKQGQGRIEYKDLSKWLEAKHNGNADAVL